MNTQQSLTAPVPLALQPMRFSWRMLLHIAAIGDLIVLVIMGIVLRDRLPLGLAVVVAVGLSLQHFRSGLLGDLLLGLLFADTTFWTLSAALVNLVQGEAPMRLFFPAALAAFSASGLIAAVAVGLTRHKGYAGGEAARMVGLVAGAFFVLVFLVGYLIGRTQPTVTTTNALTLSIENMAFATTALNAEHGQITLTVDNHDLWWHTFTIEQLGVDLKLPSNGKRQITFTAQPGVYTFYCAIPGHRMSGMEGTLTVR